MLLVVASYFFYGLWDWRFLFLILFSTIIDFSIGKLLAKKSNKTHRKGLLTTSLVVNLSLLGFFKYYNFFLDSFVDTFSFFGTSFNIDRLDIILPVGISFYTFQTLSYTIDVYRGKLKPVNDFVAFASFVSFFPQLVAGPIERATNLLPQFFKRRTFNYTKSVDGLQQILWGLFKKIVIADNAAVFVNDIFSNYQDYNGSTLVIGAIFFAFQIYCDFSGYSDIAIGVSRLFGFNLMQNFAFPYFSRDIAEFWRRWHISLSTWFRDYLYIPLGGSKGGLQAKIRNTFIIFLVSGFWHGANWTFIIWGLLNAVYIIVGKYTAPERHFIATSIGLTRIPLVHTILQTLATFTLTLIAWIFFRSSSVTEAWTILTKIISEIQLLISYPALIKSHIVDAGLALNISKPDFTALLAALLLLFIVEILIEKYKNISFFINLPRPLRWGAYYVLIGFIILAGNLGESAFIYFQF